MLCYYLGSLRQQNLSRAVRFLLLPHTALFFITSVIFYLVGVVHCLCHLFIKASVNLIQKIGPKCICNAVPSFIRRSWFCGISSRKKRPKPRLLLRVRRALLTLLFISPGFFATCKCAVLTQAWC